MDARLIAATAKLSKGTGLCAGAGDNKIIVYIFDDFIPAYVPVRYEGYEVVIKKTGRIIPA